MADPAVSPAEVARFDALAHQWWDVNGPMRALHRMNGPRVTWIAAQAERAFPGRSRLKLLDVGCGAGIAAEALTRRGFDVLGIDPAAETITAARAHAADQGLPLSYRQATIETIAADGLRYPVITALEVIEHVPNPEAFFGSLSRLCEPGALVVLSTLNRTARSFAAAKIGAEVLAAMASCRHTRLVAVSHPGGNRLAWQTNGPGSNRHRGFELAAMDWFVARRA